MKLVKNFQKELTKIRKDNSNEDNDLHFSKWKAPIA